jgi:hypothetical protein
MVERRTVVELGLSALAIVVFIAGSYLVSTTYAAERNATSNASVPPSVVPEGGLALIGVIAAFVLAVAVAGLYMYRQNFDDD